MNPFLSINEDGLLELSDLTTRRVIVDDIPDHDALREVFGEYGITEVTCSSDIDFPEEFTKDSDVISACRALRL